jgi:hypothetical protein
VTLADFIRGFFSGVAIVVASIVGCWMLVAVGQFLRGERR